MERELKFSTLDDHVPSVPELNLALDGSGLRVVPGRVSRHVDVYYDVDGALAAAGYALRRRRRVGAGPRTDTGVAYFPVQVTLKSDSTVEGALHQRTEEQWQVGPADQPWPEAVAVTVSAVPGAHGVERLRPVAELSIRRVAFLVFAAEDEMTPLAEVAFDEVSCGVPPRAGADGTAPGAHDSADLVATFHEVEIEALTDDDGSIGRLTVIADAVETIVKLTPSSASKLERAKALLDAIVGS